MIPIRSTLRPYYHSLRKKVSILRISTNRLLRRKKNGVNLIGFYSSIFGVAEVGRFFARQLNEVHIPFSITNIDSSGHRQLSADEFQFYQQHEEANSPYYRNLFFVNADIIPWMNYRHFAGRKNAAVFFWEFDDYFDFPKAFQMLDEVVVFTDFIAKAVRKSAPAGFPITKFTFPFIKNWTICSTKEEVRARLNIDKNAFVLFFNFDFHSTFDRKNPIAILKAMDLAFTNQDNVRLVCKTIHSEDKSDAYKLFNEALNAIKVKDKVILVNDAMTRDEMMSLVNATDAYISLHRSEGLGLGMMEAMSMGKPVIGTGFGGNLDFMSEHNSLLVDYTLIALENDVLPYKKGWLWAEPNVVTAATYLKELFTNKVFREEMGKKAQLSIEKQYDKQIFRKELESWLNQ
jgi:glycosyltransferase involved in cell wall biosynthesis